MKASNFAVLIGIVLCLNESSQQAFADVVATISAPTFSISNTSVPVGASITVSPDYAPSIYYSTQDYLDQNYPGDYVSLFLPYDQWTISGSGTLSAQGSVQGSGGFNYFFYNFEGGGFSNLQDTFTFDHPGKFTIDFSYSFNGAVGPLGVIYENDNTFDPNDRLVAGPFLNQVYGSMSGMGSFTVNVGGVPEICSWAMLALGFAGLGFMAHRKRKPISAY